MLPFIGAIVYSMVFVITMLTWIVLIQVLVHRRHRLPSRSPVHCREGLDTQAREWHI